MNKRYVQKARKARLQELKQLIAEATTFSYLQENKNLPAVKRKARYFISEYNRLVGAYSALLMLEFYEKGTKETLAILATIRQNNKGNQIGVFLNILNMNNLVSAMDAITQKETEGTKAAGGFESGKNMTHGGYGSRNNVAGGIGGGTYGAIAFHEALFGPAELTPKGEASKLTQDREQLMADYQKELPKVATFIDAYLAVFKEENMSKLKAKKGFLGSSPAASLIKKEFGKVPGFNVSRFIEEIAKDPDIIDINIGMAINPKNFEALTSLEDTFRKVQARTKKGLGARVADMISSFGVGAHGFKTMYESK